MTNSLEVLKPGAREAAKAFIAELVEKKIPHKVTSTGRSEDEQMALHFQSRAPLEIVNLQRKHAKMYLINEKENRVEVTKCDGVNTPSNHQGMISLDVVPTGALGQPIWPSRDDLRWVILGEIGEKHGFEWGGRWMYPDPPHYTFKG